MSNGSWSSDGTGEHYNSDKDNAIIVATLDYPLPLLGAASMSLFHTRCLQTPLSDQGRLADCLLTPHARRRISPAAANGVDASSRHPTPPTNHYHPTTQTGSQLLQPALANDT
ncbi:hypothetical protein E2562_026293 [Oryza meyeriana var. granulata]|uniref:Uncharacterized protein n=1 Tax=Oryza meyeriana var. granulata TaxID=110450 RepID=A0A6G1C8S4_9ORYZ|nr:hypothetical protein E2562_026293 [Oryza meyeriana var. granulata]